MGRQHHTSSPKQHRSKRGESASYVVTNQSTDYPETVYGPGDYQSAGASGSESYYSGSYQQGDSHGSQSYYSGSYQQGGPNGSQSYYSGSYQHSGTSVGFQSYDSGSYQQSGSSVGSQSHNPGSYQQSGPSVGFQSNVPGTSAPEGSNGSQSYSLADHQDDSDDSEIEPPTQIHQVPIGNTTEQRTVVRTYQETRVLVLHWAKERLAGPKFEAKQVEEKLGKMNRVHTTRVTIPINNAEAYVVQALWAFLNTCVTFESSRTLVLLYYVGHGSGRTGSLELGRVGTSGDRTSIRWTTIAEILQQSCHDVVAILNCCFGGTAEPLAAEVPGGTLGKTMDILTTTNAAQLAPGAPAVSMGRVLQGVLKNYLRRGVNQFSAIQLVEDIQLKAETDGYLVWVAHTPEPILEPMRPQHYQAISEG